jgi:hypothetical protein
MAPVGGSLSDNRRSTRHFVSIASKIAYEGDSVDATIINLSLGGAQVASTGKHAMGQRVVVSFHVPSLNHRIEIGATVRWADDNNGVGLQFDGLRARDVWAINEYFRRLP